MQSESLGVITFTGCSINTTGTGYTLTAKDVESGGTLTATSMPFNVALGPAFMLAFRAQPGGGANGTAWTNQPTVTVDDAGGNIVSAATNTVSLIIGSQPATGAAIGCTLDPVAASGGQAAFTGCEIVGKIGSYTLSATSPGLVTGTSLPFSLTVGTATQLAFTTEPGGGANGVAWNTQPSVSVEDSGGNTVSSTASIKLTVDETAGGSLACTTNPKNAVAGVATFAGCNITGTAGAYSIAASSSGLTTATSNIFTITFGTPTQLVFTTQPGGGVDGTAWGTQPAAAVEDASGNLVTTSTSNITLSIHSQPAAGASLGCTSNPVAASGGVATFAGCEISGTVGSYTLTRGGRRPYWHQ